MKATAGWSFPPKKILVPLDLTDASLAAWEEGRVLARRFQAELKGLYVQEWLHAALGLGGGDPYLTAELGRLALEAFRTRLGESADVSTAPGGVEETVLSWGTELGFDLVVMGTHGRSGLARALQGSVAEAIVRQSSLPVLVTRRAPEEFKRVLAPVNLESHSLAGLSYAAELAAAFGGELVVLHVLSEPVYGDAASVRGVAARLEEALKGLPPATRAACRARTHLAFGDPAERIVFAAAEADAVVMAAHRKGFVHDTLLGTTAERVLRHSPAPVWTVPTVAAPAASPKAPAALAG